MRLSSLRLAVVSTGVVTALAGGVAYGVSTRPAAAPAAAPATTTTAPRSTTAPPSTTTAPPTTTTTTAPTPADEPRVVEGGTREVFDLQVRLAQLGYDVGTPDGRYGERTYFSVIAFQKIEGLYADGQAGPAVLAALAGAAPPGPVVPGGAPTRIEIDLDRQVLLRWQGGNLARVLPVSTGNGQWYCVDGICDVAITPTGTYRIGRRASGLEVSYLGELYNPMYFHLGWAIHGSPSVPNYPASAGCVRVPMYASASLFDQVPSGTLVYVVGENPPTLNAPPSTSAPPPPTTSPTTGPATTVVTTTTTAPPPTTTTTRPPTTTTTTSPASTTTSTTAATTTSTPSTTAPATSSTTAPGGDP